jgi:1-deoxy-D-xylulose-5-phosphate synthase
MVLALAVPGMTVMAPSSAEDLEQMLETALGLDGPSTIRFPTSTPRHVGPDRLGSGMHAVQLRRGDGSICMLGVGKLVGACEEAATLLAATGIEATVWDVRVVSPPGPAMLADAARHCIVVTAEDGLRVGGAGTFLADALATVAADAGIACPPVTTLGTPRAYIPHGRPEEVLADLGLDAPGVADAVRRAKRVADQALLAP